MLDELFSVEEASWKGRTGTAMKSFEELGRFSDTFHSCRRKRGNVRIFFLRVNGEPIAGQLTVVHANRLWVFKIGHNESWSWCSPGILLMHRVMKYCFDEGLDACELLGSDEPWLHIWGRDTHSVLTYRIYPRVLLALPDLTVGITGLLAYKIKSKVAKRIGKRKQNAEEGSK